MMTLTEDQLEIRFETPVVTPWRGRREQKIARSRWWFQQMHQAVEQAIDWSAETFPTTDPKEVN